MNPQFYPLTPILHAYKNLTINFTLPTLLCKNNNIVALTILSFSIVNIYGKISWLNPEYKTINAFLFCTLNFILFSYFSIEKDSMRFQKSNSFLMGYRYKKASQLTFHYSLNSWLSVGLFNQRFQMQWVWVKGRLPSPFLTQIKMVVSFISFYIFWI